MDRSPATQSLRRPVLTSTAVAAATGVRPAPFSAYPPGYPASLKPAKQAVWPEDDDREIECEHDERLVGRIEQKTAEGFDDPDQCASEEAAENVAEAAERDSDVGQERKVRAHLGKNVIEGREHGAGDPDAAYSDRPTQREHALGRNAHHRCCLTILRGRLQAETRLGAGDEPPQRGKRQEADAAGDQLR